MNEDNIEDLFNDVFPNNFDYKIIKCEKVEVNNNQLKFDLELRVNVCDEKGIDDFFQQFYQT